MSRMAMYPARMQIPACGDQGTLSVDCASAAASSTAPADVTQERWGLGDRKKASDAKVVWVSFSSENQLSHSSQSTGSSSSHPIMLYRVRRSTALGGGAG